MKKSKQKHIENLQSLIALNILCTIAFSFAFLYGPILGVIRLYFFFQQPSVEWETSPNNVNILALIAFAILFWIKNLLRKRIDLEKSYLQS